MSIMTHVDLRNSDEFDKYFRDLDKVAGHRYNVGFFAGSANMVPGKQRTLSQARQEIDEASLESSLKWKNR